MSRLAAFVDRRARRILAGAVVFFFIAAAVGAPVAGQLTRTSRDFQDPHSESAAARDRVEAATGSEPGYGVVALLLPGGDPRRARGAAAAVRDVEATLRRDPAVERTLSWTSTRDPRLVSRDGSATAVLVRLRPDADEQDATDRFRRGLRGADVRLGGGDVVGPAIGSQVSEDLAHAEMIAFPILFALSLSRIKEARDGGQSDREAVAFGVERTGRIVTPAAMLFIVAVGAFAASGVLFIKQVGIGTAIAVAIAATLVRALLVPALMALLGRWNWWAPAPLRRLHERIGISEGPTPPQGAPA